MAKAPGLYYKGRAPDKGPDPLRSDVAGFIGRTRRGPLIDDQGKVAEVRAEGWRRYQLLFGDLARGACPPYTPYAIRGFYDNGGQVAHVIRVGGTGAAVATADWDVAGPLVGRVRSANG